MDSEKPYLEPNVPDADSDGDITYRKKKEVTIKEDDDIKDDDNSTESSHEVIVFLCIT